MSSPFYIPKITYGGFIPTVISFDYPPKEDKDESLVPVQKVTESLSGATQTSTNYIEGQRKLTFSFVSEAIKEQLRIFYRDFAIYGNSFKYYDDKNSVSYITVQLDKRNFVAKRTHPKGINTYLYDITLDIRRAVDEDIAEGYMEQSILNNQAISVAFTGFVLDKDSYKSARCFYEIFRKTGSSERIANGEVVFTYKISTDTWVAQPGTFEGDEDHGVTFTVTAAGQVGYTSDNMSGTSYVGNALLRNFTIIGG